MKRVETRTYAERKLNPVYMERRRAYARSKGKQHEAARRTKKVERKAWAIEHLGGKCFRCGGAFPQCAFDFHHRNPSEKLLEPSHMFHRSQKYFESELAKCDLLCANCHRIVHYEESKEIKK